MFSIQLANFTSANIRQVSPNQAKCTDSIFDIPLFRLHLLKLCHFVGIVAHNKVSAVRPPRCPSSTLNQSAYTHDAVEANDQVARGHIKAFLQHIGGYQQFALTRAELSQNRFLLFLPFHTECAFSMAKKLLWL